MFSNNFGNFQNVECGLVYIRPGTNCNIPVPLTNVSVTGAVAHAVAQVEIAQVYSNKESDAIEAIYIFPIDSNGAVTHFHAELEGSVIKGIVKTNEDAKDQYDTAVRNGQTAFLGGENKPDIFQVRIGCLRPGAEVKVVIGYVTEVKNDPDTHSIRFFIPTTICPRYVPSSGNDAKSRELANMEFISGPSAPLVIKVVASIQGKIACVECHTHKVVVESKGPIPEKPSWYKSVITLDGNVTQMDRDFVLLIIPEAPMQPRLYSETLENGSVALMTHLIPSFKLVDQKVELIIVMDQSGSMRGTNINMARKALSLFLHSMPVDCYFNIVGFGSSYFPLFQGSKKYDENTLHTALNFANNLNADLGGTEILAPLEYIYSQAPVEGYLRQLFVITDGAVSNTEAVIGLVRTNAHSSRLFALGIGSSASHHLVEGIAQAGGGTCDFVHSEENIQKQTLGQLKNALQPCLTDIKVEWIGLEEPQKPAPILNKEKTLFGYNKPLQPLVNEKVIPNYIQAPRKIPPIFDGAQMLVIGLFKKNGRPTGAKITAESPDGPLTVELELAGIKIVRELEIEETGFPSSGRTGVLRAEEIRKEIVDIALQNGIVSKYTSFIAVDESKSLNEWVMQTRYVPSKFPSRWQLPPQRQAQSARLRRAGALVRNIDAYPSHSSTLSFEGPSDCLSVGATFPPGCSVGATSALGRSVGATSALGRSFGATSALGCSSAMTHVPYFSHGMSPPIILPDTDALNLNTSRTGSSSSENLVMSKLHALINLQSFQGSFPLDNNLASLITLDLNTLKERALAEQWDETAWATALAIVFMTQKLPELKDFWELVATKGQKWIEQSHPQVYCAIFVAADSIIQ